jgi:hypothetical protein
MSAENAEVSDGGNRNAIIIAVTIVVLAIILIYFWDRQSKRTLELRRIDTQTDVWEEWGLPQQNGQLNNASAKSRETVL